LINYVNEWVTESIEFMSSSKLGAKCQNNMFVGDYKNGNLYMLKLNKDRTGIEFDNSQQSAGLSDLVVDNKNELNAVNFGSGFNSITDIKTGPDGLLYVLSFGDGSIYRISPTSAAQ
jgi:aldose sugar dehydrogenase